MLPVLPNYHPVTLYAVAQKITFLKLTTYNYDTRSRVLLTLSNTAVAYTAARDDTYRTRESSPGLLARCYHLYYVRACAELCWRTACISNVHNAYKAMLLTGLTFVAAGRQLRLLMPCVRAATGAHLYQKTSRSKQTNFLSFMGL